MQRINILIIIYLTRFFFADFFAETPTCNASCKEKEPFWNTCFTIFKSLFAKKPHELMPCKQEYTIGGYCFDTPWAETWVLKIRVSKGTMIII